MSFDISNFVPLIVDNYNTLTSLSLDTNLSKQPIPLKKRNPNPVYDKRTCRIIIKII